MINQYYILNFLAKIFIFIDFIFTFFLLFIMKTIYKIYKYFKSCLNF
jgi:hypothetical protein